MTDNKMDIGRIWEIGKEMPWTEVQTKYSSGEILKFGVNYLILNTISDDSLTAFGRYEGCSCFGNALMLGKIERNGNETKNIRTLIAIEQEGDLLKDKKDIERINYCYDNKLEATQ